jgi:hypothetical protein
MNTSTHSEARLALPANLTVRAIISAREDLLKFMDAHDAATIALADDVQVDISFIQMIEAARIHAETVGKRIALSQPATGALLETLRRSGFLEGMSAEDAKFWLHQGVNQ